MDPPDPDPDPESIIVELDQRDLRSGVSLGKPEPLEQVIHARPTAQAQHEREEAKAAAAFDRDQKRVAEEYERRKDFARFCAGLFVVLAVFAIAAGYVVTTPSKEPTWATGALTTLLGLAIPFVLPKK